MSIPPLVCSTPPPPDQCVEDKDPEDFDLHYNLSQDGEDNESNDFEYSSYSTYSQFQSHVSSGEKENISTTHIVTDDNLSDENSCDKAPPSPTQLSVDTKTDQYEEISVGKLKDINSGIVIENSFKCDEDNNIEDLDLKLEENLTSSRIPSIEESYVNKYDFSLAQKDNLLNIPNIDSEVNDNNFNDAILKTQPEYESKSNNVDESIAVEEEFVGFESQDIVDTIDDNLVLETDLAKAELNESNENLEILSNDDFEDFNDFQFNTSANKTTNILIDNCDNPWDSEIDKDKHGEFTANFDHNESENSNIETVENSDNAIVDKIEETQINAEDDDDFGDFDDFKLSNVVSITEPDISHEDQALKFQPVLNLELPNKGHQILDSINQVLNSIFEDYIPEPEIEFECKLESLLSETWGHLMETDVRQPYIVNWNNSLGQKTLLRALCIDSRNILFGPKWSHNMPKYAANLSAAPLMPQKPILPLNTSQNEPVTCEKEPNKVSTGSDPLSYNSQESCNKKNEAAITEKKLKVSNTFENSLPTNCDNTYSKKITVQPLRQISLPDTHIFTPTDSQIPRSKTIHYDTGPTVILPEIEPNNSNFHTENSMEEPEEKTEFSNLESSEYWEFQNYKCPPKLSTELEVTSIQTMASTSDESQKRNKNYQCELLEPIKIIPDMPKLNWPEPGEVKEAFDDFSDFLSSPSWNKQPKDMQFKPIESRTIENHTDIKIEETKPSFDSSFDDEFDTFQCALPSQNANEVICKDNVVTNPKLQELHSIPLTMMQNLSFDEAFSKLNLNTSDTVSPSNLQRPSETSAKTLPSMSSFKQSSSKNPMPFSKQLQSTTILQPTPASSTFHNNQNTAQILQPLSLESYSQLNWPSPGIDLQDLSRFNPVETLHSLKSDLSASTSNKTSSPVHNPKNNGTNSAADDEVWGEFISSKPKSQLTIQNKTCNFGDDDEWTDFVCNPNVKPQNGLNTISLNVHTNLNMLKNSYQNKVVKNSPPPLDIPTLNYITPKTNNHKTYTEKHFQNL